MRLENQLKKSRLYNDVAFITKDNRLLVLIEHQTTLNKNMLFRMLEYYIALVSKFIIKEKEQNKYGSKEIEIPKAEFHIVYNGKGKMDELPQLDLGDIQVEASVCNIHFSNLTHHDPNHPLIAYAKYIELTVDKKLDINDAIDQLLEEGYLLEFFGRREIRDMFVDIFSYDQQLIEEASEKKQMEIVKNGLENNVPIETISVMTGLSAKEIEAIRGKIT